LAALDDDPAPEVRVAAVQTLAQLGARDEVPRLRRLVSDPEPTVRVAAIRALGVLGGDAELPVLLRALGDPSAEVRAATLDTLGGLSGGDVVAPAASMLSDPDQKVVISAIQVLARRGDPSASFPLLEKVKAGQPQVQLEAIRALGRLGDPRAVLPLAGLLYSSFPELRVAAVEALGELRDPRATPHLVRLLWSEHNGELGGPLMRALGRSGDPAAAGPLLQVMRESPSGAGAADALKALGPGVMPEVLRTLQQSQDGREQRLCLDILQALSLDGRLSQAQRRELAQALVPALDEGRWPEREIVAALLALRAPEALEPLLRRLVALQREQTPEAKLLRGQLLGGLGGFGDVRVVQPLLALYEGFGRVEQGLALDVLAGCPSVEAIPLLAKASQHGETPTRLRALRALGRIDHPDAAKALLDPLQTGHTELLQEAALGLGAQTRDPSLVGSLLGFLRRGGEVRLAALMALTDLGRRAPSPELEAAARELVEQGGEPRLVGRALDVLAVMPPSSASVGVLRGSYKDAPLETKVKIVQVLGEWRAVEGLPLLREALRAPEARLRAEAAWSLGEFEGLEGADIEALVGLLGDEAWPVPLNASGALARVGRVQDAPAMSRALEGSEGAQRANLLLGLLRLGEAPPARDLAAWVERDGDPWVIEAAARVVSSRQGAGDEALWARLKGKAVGPELGRVFAALEGSPEEGDPWRRTLLTDERLRPSAGERVVVTRGDGVSLGRTSDLSGEVRVERLPRGEVRVFPLDHEFQRLSL
jgi:HEAT repeat protein